MSRGVLETSDALVLPIVEKPPPAFLQAKEGSACALPSFRELHFFCTSRSF